MLTYQTIDRLATIESSEAEQKDLQQSEGKTTTTILSDESSESVVSVRSDENISNKGSPVKKATVSSSEVFEASTEEVCVYVCIHQAKVFMCFMYTNINYYNLK